MQVEHKKIADSHFYTVSSSSSNGSTTDAQGACSSRTSFLQPNRISDIQANSLEDYVESTVMLQYNKRKNS